MTHPEPRVEWEVVLGDKPGLWYKLKHNGKTERMGCPDNLKELGRYLTRAFNDFLSHSVQEAKAEEMYKERNLWIVAIQSALFYGTNLKTLRNHLKGMLPDAPSKNKISDPQKNLPVESVSHIKAVNGERL